MSGTVRGAAQEQLDQAGERASELCAEEGTTKSTGTHCACEQYISQRPLRSVLTAAGIAWLLGRFWKRRVDGRRTHGTLGPIRQISVDARVDRRGRRGALLGQGRARSVDAGRPAELLAQPDLRLARATRIPAASRRYWLRRVTCFVVLGLVIWTAVVQLTDLAPKLPEYQSNIEVKLHSVNDYLSTTLSRATHTARG